LITRDGFNLGTLCIIDREPRTLTRAEAGILTNLATLVMGRGKGLAWLDLDEQKHSFRIRTRCRRQDSRPVLTPVLLPGVTMPFLSLKLSTPESADTTSKVIAVLMDLTVDVLKKKRELTSIAIEYVAPRHWFIGGTALTPESDAGIYLEIKVTEGTNTKDQKKAFVEQVTVAMRAILGKLQAASYVVIQEVRADAWGYHGVTQEARYVLDSAIAPNADASAR
jgi:4-oxalocrotonate tautomerase